MISKLIKWLHFRLVCVCYGWCPRHKHELDRGYRCWACLRVKQDAKSKRKEAARKRWGITTEVERILLATSFNEDEITK